MLIDYLDIARKEDRQPLFPASLWEGIRQTEGQTDRHTDRHTDTPTDTPTDRLTDASTDR